jgi:ketosteroid isomerase-like protein
MTDIERRIAILEDIEAIRRLKLKYARLCDTGYDADALAALFTEDAVWDAGDLGSVRGRAEIRAYWQQTAENVPFAVHYISNHTVDVAPDGSTAGGTCYLWQPMTMNGQALWAAVVYDERYVKQAGDWLFEEMRLTTRMLTPYEEGWVKQPMAG